MNRKKFKRKLAAARQFYFSIGSVLCPALDNELVFFDERGFKHITWKYNTPRGKLDQIRRFRLLPDAVKIIASNQTIINEIRIHGDITLWELSDNITSDRNIKVIVMKIKLNKRYFLSVMSRQK